MTYDAIDTGPNDNAADGSGLIQSLEITNETLVQAEKTTDQSISAATETTVTWDSENKDERGEFDVGNNQFVPDQTGWYLVVVSVNFQIGADQDNVLVRLVDSTASNVLRQNVETASGADPITVQLITVLELTGGNAHDVRVLNNDSSDTVGGIPVQTYWEIRGVFR